MEFQIKDVTDVQKEISIQVPAAELQPKFEEAYKKQGAELAIRGFRKGKVPLPMIKRLFGEAIEKDSLGDIAPEILTHLIEDQKIAIIGEPAIVAMDYKRGEQLSFTVKYEVNPTVTLGEYKNIPVEKIIHEVTDLEVDEEIDRIRKANSTYAPAERAEDSHHIITADIQELDPSGAPLIGKHSEDMKINLSDPDLFPEVRDAMSGAAVGDVRKTTFASKHGDHSHDHFLEVTIKGIEKIVMPELDDEFVKKVTKEKVATVDEFRQNIRTDLETYWEEESERHLEDNLANELVRRHDFNIPDALVKVFTDSQIESIARQSPDKKLPKKFDEEKYRKEYYPTAVWQAKWYLVREEIVKAENITADDADLEQRAEIDAPKMGMEKERLLTFYKSSESIKNRIINERLMDFLKAHAQITDVDDRSLKNTVIDTATPESGEIITAE